MNIELPGSVEEQLRTLAWVCGMRRTLPPPHSDALIWTVHCRPTSPEFNHAARPSRNRLDMAKADQASRRVRRCGGGPAQGREVGDAQRNEARPEAAVLIEGLSDEGVYLDFSAPPSYNLRKEASAM